MRLFLAVVFLLATWSGLAAAYQAWFPHAPDALTFALILPWFGVPMWLATLLFNKHLSARLRRLTEEEYLSELEAKGQLDREAHVAGRVLSFEDLNTSCQVYLIEAPGRGTLMLYGQYLYSYEPSVPEDLDEDELPEPRTFPTERFELLRKRGDEDILTIARSGRVIEPEAVNAPEGDFYSELMVWPMDGRMITTPTFDELRERLRRPG